VHPEGLRNWIRQDEADRGEREDRPPTDLVEENRRLRKEVAELRRVNDILKAASSYFAQECDQTRRGREVRRPTSGPVGGRAPAWGAGHRGVKGAISGVRH